MSNLILKKRSFPALYNASRKASAKAQNQYYSILRGYLAFLIAGALVSYLWPLNQVGSYLSAGLFLLTMGLLIWLKVKNPESIWYNCRAVTESVKTRTWRWVMRAEPYENKTIDEHVQKAFISDLKKILDQNKSVVEHLEWASESREAISEGMKAVREAPFSNRLELYKTSRIDNQAQWYADKAKHNKRMSNRWFGVSVFLHCVAVAMLLYRIKEPQLSLPISVIATAASAVLTWLQAKKHNELNASYSLAASEILFIKNEADLVTSEEMLSDLVLNSESAFSREHTQWVARKNA